MKRADVLVVGGGAAGLMAAGTAAEEGARVLLAEGSDRLGRKLRITGKGRCNLTNDTDVRGVLAAVRRNPKFLYSAMTAFPPAAVMTFFEGLGVPLKTERGGRVFPQSDSAHDIADALAGWALGRGVRVFPGRVTALARGGDGLWRARTAAGEELCADAVILCPGGASYPATGSDGAGYALARALGHTVTPPRPSLVPLECADECCAALAGFPPRNVTLTVYEDGRAIFRQMGEMLFAHFGVTGPLVLSASACMDRLGEAAYTLSIDFKPALDPEQLDRRILRDLEAAPNRDVIRALSGLAPRSLLPILLERAGLAPDTKAHSVPRDRRRALGERLKDFRLTVTGPRPLAEAIVTRGGVEVRELDPRSMASRLAPGLYFAGEILDVDALTGGFNLQIAWATGRCAGLHAGRSVTA